MFRFKTKVTLKFLFICKGIGKRKVLVPTIKTYVNEGVEVRLILLLTTVLDDGEWSASRPGGFTPGKRASHYPSTMAGWPLELVWSLLDKG
jgi:hypothetical protein